MINNEKARNGDGNSSTSHSSGGSSSTNPAAAAVALEEQDDIRDAQLRSEPSSAAVAAGGDETNRSSPRESHPDTTPGAAAAAADFAVTVHDGGGGGAAAEEEESTAPEEAVAAATSQQQEKDENNKGENNKKKKSNKKKKKRRRKKDGDDNQDDGKQQRRGRRVDLQQAGDSFSSSTIKQQGTTANNTKKRQRLRRRRRPPESNPQLPIPPNQYECTLYRRAVRKREEEEENNHREHHPGSTNLDDNGLEICGDISLGMKLTVVSGKVIVQKLNALDDGRASPAQLVGIIRRGDVLLSINHSNLVNLPLEQLMKGLSPLSTPIVDDKTGGSYYQRELQLRFSSGEGLALLDKVSPATTMKTTGDAQQQNLITSSSQHGDEQQQQDGANDIFNLFPMVDQLSGMPLVFFDQGSGGGALGLSAIQEQKIVPPSPPPSSKKKYWSLSSSKKQQQQQQQQQQQSGAEAEGQLIVGTKSITKTKLPLDEAISGDLARDRIRDRKLFISEFFAWKGDDFDNCLLKEPAREEEEEKDDDQRDDNVDDDAQQHTEASSNTLTLSQLVERGRRAIIGARALSDRVDKIDRGKFDIRSFKSWKSTLSQYSRASARRRKQVFDAASVPVNFGRVVEGEDEDGSCLDDSNAGTDDGRGGEELLDADEVLLRLAAHDEPWRKQVIDYLEKAMHDAEGGGGDDQDEPDHHHTGIAPPLSEEEEKKAATDDLITNELGNFLLGESMAKILSKRKRPKTLPPDEITSVLFDLVTKVSATIPDEIMASGGSQDSRGPSAPLDGGPFPPAPSTAKKTDPQSNSVLATRFLLDEALPAWLRSFRPLPWEQRRILWPVDRPSGVGGSTVGSTLSDESLGSAYTFGQQPSLSPSGTARTIKSRKNLRERVEEHELDATTRVETCFLATYYFAQKLLPELMQDKQSDNGNINAEENYDKALKETLSFIKEYGSYLKMHACLAYSAVIEADAVVSCLLDLAKHDPSHKDMMKHSGKGNSLVFYEPTMLSAVVQKLHDLPEYFVPELWLGCIDLCAAAYPDLQPWQVRKICLDEGPKSAITNGGAPQSKNSPTQRFEDLYYIYLSLILHPMNGHGSARRNPSLVKEWCELSVRKNDHGTFKDRSTDRLKNFFSVASRTSSDHLLYARDLVLLLKISKEIDDVDLVFDLAGEILENSDHQENIATIGLALEYLKNIATNALESFETNQPASTRRLKRILRIYRSATSCTSPIVHDLLQVPHEILNWLLLQSSSPTDPEQKTLHLIRFLADEATPSDVLEAARSWTAESRFDLKVEMLPVLQTLLRRAAEEPRSYELSGALLRLRRARDRLHHSVVVGGSDSHQTAAEASQRDGDDDDDDQELNIWKRMSSGMVAVLK